MTETLVVRPQEGPQEAFLSTPADIAIYGGAAGGGKTYALLMEPLRFYGRSDFAGTIFRRTIPQIIAEGGLWDTSTELYAPLGATGIQQPYRWVFPSGMRLEFHHMQLERNYLDWQGAQIPFIGWDELTHFTRKQFFYMLSRNRNPKGTVRPYIRATCNPDPDSWVKEFVRWWLDDEGQYADLSKAGVIRYMIVQNDEVIWFSDREEANGYNGSEAKSVTFIPSSIHDNKILLEKDPSYLSSLHALTRVEKERLLNGNWKVRAAAGTIFRRDDFEIVDAAPAPDMEVRFWDRAASEPSASYPDPDWTVGVRMQKTGDEYFITEVKRLRGRPGAVKKTIKNTASQDSKRVIVGLYVDPGQAGKVEYHDYVTLLAGWPILTLRETTKKYLRWRPVAAQAQAGRVKLLRGIWNEAYLTEMENLSEDEDTGHDDQGDATAGAFELLSTRKRWGRAA